MTAMPPLLRRMTASLLRHVLRFPWEAGGERKWRLL